MKIQAIAIALAGALFACADSTGAPSEACGIPGTVEADQAFDCFPVEYMLEARTNDPPPGLFSCVVDATSIGDACIVGCGIAEADVTTVQRVGGYVVLGDHACLPRAGSGE